MSLAPCPRCGRHVRSADPACPFCGAPVRAPAARPSPAPRLGRAAILAFGVAVAACGSPEGPRDTTAGATAATSGDDHTDPADGPAHAPSDPPPPDDGGGPVPLYGAPAPPR